MRTEGRADGQTWTTLYDLILCISYKKVQHVISFLSEIVKIIFNFKYIYVYTLLPNATQYQKKHCFLAGSQASPICPSGKSNVQMKMSMKCWWNHIAGINRSIRRKTWPSTSCLPQNSSGLIWDRIWATDVRGPKLTAWAMVQHFEGNN